MAGPDDLTRAAAALGRSAAYLGRIARYMAAHPGASLGAARGHGATPEHGRTPGPGTHAGGRTVYTTTSSQQAEKIVRQAARDGKRVSLAVNDTRHPRGTAPAPVAPSADRMKPDRARTVTKRMRRGGMTLRKYLGTTFTAGGGRSPGDTPSEIEQIEITVYD